MFCSECGNELKKGLKYCNSCGGKIAKNEGEETSKSVVEKLIIGGTIVTLSGLALLVGLVAILFANGFPFEYIIFVMVAFLVALSGICFMFLRPVSKFMNAGFEKKDEAEKSYQPAQLAEPTVARLNESPYPVASVTENTTRTLDEVLIERK